MSHLYIGLLAGGSGTRLWPLSTNERPKQLIKFPHNKSLIEQTIDRVSPLVSDNDHIFVVTTKQYQQAISDHIGNRVGFFVVEPEGRNTAPAILLACHTLREKDPQAVVMFVPSDHIIPDDEQFRSIAQELLDHVTQHSHLGIIGIKPAFPSTAYGYIQLDKKGNGPLFPVLSFHEKPAVDQAEFYWDRHDMMWNVGIVAGTLATFFREYIQHAPVLTNMLELFSTGLCSYADSVAVSFDYAVLEKSRCVVAIQKNFEWYDVGNLATFFQVKERFGEDRRILLNIESKNNSAYTSKKIVTCIGVDNLYIVETEHVILIVNKDKTELVKQVAQKAEELIS